MNDTLIFSRMVGNNRIDVMPLTYGRARIGVANKDDRMTYLDTW